jgi:hypothetical protein
MMAAINTAINVSAPGKLRLYNGTRPASGGSATTLLSELTFANPAAPSASGGVLTMSAIVQDSSAAASGTATWFRVVDGANTFVVDGDITATGGGGDLQLITTSIIAGQPVQVTSMTFTASNA